MVPYWQKTLSDIYILFDILDLLDIFIEKYCVLRHAYKPVMHIEEFVGRPSVRSVAHTGMMHGVNASINITHLCLLLSFNFPVELCNCNPSTEKQVMSISII